MKNPHIRTLPSRWPSFNRPRSLFGFMTIRQLARRARKAQRLWLRGEGPKPELLGGEIGSVSRFTFMVSE